MGACNCMTLPFKGLEVNRSIKLTNEKIDLQPKDIESMNILSYPAGPKSIVGIGKTKI